MAEGVWRGGAALRTAPPAEAIERLSLRRLGAAVAGRMPAAWDAEERRVALRMAYAQGDPSLVATLAFAGRPVRAAVAALARGAPVVADVEMVRAGVSAARLARLGGVVHTAVRRPEVQVWARESSLTRTALGLYALRSALPGAVLAVGNAPTALLALFDLLDEGVAPPAAVVATPPGFVLAAEAKEALLARGLPAAVVRGSRGGSSLAAAALNACLALALGEEDEGCAG